jgi:predicted dehydrogenase
MTVSVGIVGAGGIARTHAEILGNHERAEVVAVCDIDAERAQGLAESADAAAYTDHGTLLETEDPDAVYVTTPPQARVDLVRDIARSDAAIFCEKPLATTVEAGRAVRDVVEDHDVPFMVGFCSRFAEPCRRLHALLDDGDLGEPVQVFSTRAGYGVPAGDNWRTDPDQACGVTVESTSHNVDLLRWLGGEVEAASGQVTNVTHPEIDQFDDNVVATLQFADGPIGLVQNSWTSHVEYLRHGVVGTAGAAVVEGDQWWRLDRLTCVTEADQYPTTISFDSETATDMGYTGETDAFVRSLVDGTAPPVGLSDGLRALEISHEILSG